MIISNQMRCHSCGDTPFSAHRHDMKYCKCGAIAVDGGTSYLRRAASEGASYTDISITIDDEVFKEVTAELDAALKAAVYSPADFVIMTFQLLEERNIRAVETYDVGISVIRRAALVGVTWALETGRNGFGLLSAVMREVRDAGSSWEGEGMDIG